MLSPLFSNGIIAIEGTFSSSSEVNTKNKTTTKAVKPPNIANLGSVDSCSSLADTLEISVSGRPWEVMQ